MLMGRCRVQVDGEVWGSCRWGGVGFMSMGRCRVHVDGECWVHVDGEVLGSY